MGIKTRDGRIQASWRIWPWTRDTLRRCCALQVEMEEGAETWSRRPPNCLSADVMGKALERYSDHLERECERRRGGMKTDWRKSVESREDGWRRTALGETDSETPLSRSPPPQIGPAIDED